MSFYSNHVSFLTDMQTLLTSSDSVLEAYENLFFSSSLIRLSMLHS